MKSGVAAMMYTATLLKRNQDTFSGNLTLVFNVDEERINLGMLHYIKDGILEIMPLLVSQLLLVYASHIKALAAII
ncbi:M20/M25/M40 family metallo-hydrolase [Providencia hangzhouensis]|uniref:M20/M25/M40 family metallo-hydrolase n=1 Tax=Providencia hangzhouensis TaxID=3031799 RepID=UPI0034DDC1ED